MNVYLIKIIINLHHDIKNEVAQLKMQKKTIYETQNNIFSSRPHLYKL